MTKVRGIDSIVSQLRREKTNLAGELKQVDERALSVLGKFERQKFHPAETFLIGLSSP